MEQVVWGALERPQVKMNEFGRNAAKISSAKRASGKQRREILKTNLAQLAGSLAILSLVAIISLTQIHSARADAAQSEVWSESDGLQVKYSTNHDSLSSSKGSELSLSSDQQNQRQAEPAAASAEGAEASGGESQSPASGAESSGQPASEGSAGGEQASSSGSGGADEATDGARQEEAEEAAGGEESNEQGAADSRQSEKSILPNGGRTQSSYSSIGSKSSQRQPHKSASSGFSDVPTAQQRSSKSPGRALHSAETFESLGPSFEMGNSEAPAAASEEQTSADPDSNDSSGALQERGRFRQPGRLFKEAMRMTSDGDDNQNQVAGPSADRPANVAESDDKEDQSDSPKETDRSSGKPTETSKNNDDDDDDNDGGDDADNEAGNTWGKKRGPSGVSPSSAASKRMQQQDQDKLNLISDDGSSFGMSNPDGAPVNLQENLQHQQLVRSMGASTGAIDPSRSQFAVEADDDFGGHLHEQPAVAPQNVPMFYDQSGRSLLAASSQRGLTQPLTSSQTPIKLGPQQQQPQPQQQAGLHKLPDKQLAYFRGVNFIRDALKQPMRSQAAAAVSDERLNDRSPDSVRDNFISPGHYPGSMPHLTQAASEFATNVQKNSAPADKGDNVQKLVESIEIPSTTKPSEAYNDEREQPMKPSSQGANSEPNGPKNANSMPLQEGAGSGQLGRMTGATPSDTTKPDSGNQQAESKQELVTIAVTPMPELQVESQQIMAPILVSTTTMAPLPSTTAPTSSMPNVTATTAGAATQALASTNATTTASTASKAATQLKRFKFRKYR